MSDRKYKFVLFFSIFHRLGETEAHACYSEAAKNISFLITQPAVHRLPTRAVTKCFTAEIARTKRGNDLYISIFVETICI